MSDEARRQRLKRKSIAYSVAPGISFLILYIGGTLLSGRMWVGVLAGAAGGLMTFILSFFAFRQVQRQWHDR